MLWPNEQPDGIVHTRPPPQPSPTRGEGAGWRWLVLAVLALALALRLVAAGAGPLTGDERDQLHGLGLNHPLLAVLLIQLPVGLGSTSAFAVRLPFVLLSVAGLAFAYPLVRRGFGRWPALLALLLLTVDQFHLVRSRTASEAVALAFVPAILYFFYRAVTESRPNLFAVVGFLIGLGYYAKEDTLLLLPVLALFLLVKRSRRRFFRSRELYLGLAIILLMVAGDVYLNLTGSTHNLSRAVDRTAGIGLTLRATSLYLGELFLQFVGSPAQIADFVWRQDRWSTEVPPMNWVAGLVCLAAAVFATERYRDELTALCLWVFWPIFAVVSLVRPEHGFFELDQVKWAGATLVPAAILAGDLLFRRAGPWLVGRLLAVILFVYLTASALSVCLVQDNVYVIPREAVRIHEQSRSATRPFPPGLLPRGARESP